MQRHEIEQIRSFNRLVAQRIGALQDSYLACGRPLAEARVVFEAGRQTGGVELRVLRQGLGLDSAYMSRLLRALERQGLIEVRRSAADARARRVMLTAEGERQRAAYDRLSDELACSLLEPLGAAQRKRLVGAMAEVERLLRAAAVEIASEPADSADAQWCLARYYDELALRFDAGFDPGRGGAFTAAEMTPPAGLFLVARLDGSPVGCGALKRLGAASAEVKRIWTAPEVRGMGVASRIMDRLESSARELGFRTVRLDTNRALTEAQALYLKRGYRAIERYNDNPYAHYWFEKEL